MPLLDLVDPATGGVRSSLATSDTAAVTRAVDAAAAAFPDWSRSTPGARADALLALAGLVEEHAEELALLDSEDVGKPVHHAREELPGVVDNLRFLAGASRVPSAGSAGEYAAGRTSTLRREPLGVVALVTPWNYPLLEAVWKVAPALAAGNTAVVKPSELTPRSTLRLVELAARVLPAGVLGVVLGGAEVGQALVRDPRVRLVSLTGDSATGSAVAATAAESLTRVHLELGGKAPVVVCDDADLDDAVATLVPAGFLNAGQDCTAACRVLVADSVHDAFLAAYVEAVRDLRVGDPADEDTRLGPLVSRRQLDRVAGFVDRAVAGGARVEVGGRRLERPGWFYAPTVLTGVGQRDEVVQREVFGPVVTVQRAPDDEALLALANDVEQGLAASVWTASLARADRFTRGLDFGTVWVNDHLTTVSEMPFGGFGASGYGAELSTRSIDDYSRFKHVMTRVPR
ncbi:aldehyde dehydrogenase family protein [Nocardioides kribbensis]|uniref:aldehyde dehydrogenase family protein n=1 Tax=Nocardioides kribbensis TaxID=305517 RepID=UPI00187A551D|nr:aldehyde dehydrogenase family protein [Nocardioides kribbensis]